MKKPCIIALDLPSKKEIENFLTLFGDEKLYVKVGMELSYAEGPAILNYLKEHGHDIFLDLKLHDIPNTVKSAMRQLAGFGVDLVNVHATGGQAMMEAAIEGLEQGTPFGMKRPYCIAVTQLTSTSQYMLNRELLIPTQLDEAVVHFAALAKTSGIDGVVCSALEVPMIRQNLGKDFITVTPGIRMKDSEVGDQVRVVTPDEARRLGSDFIVVGRNITQATDPVAAYQKVLQLWEDAK